MHYICSRKKAPQGSIKLSKICRKKAPRSVESLHQNCLESISFQGLRPLILQSHYPNRRSADSRRAKFWKIGRRRPIVGRHRHRFWLILWSADDFFVEAPKLKVSLTDPPIFIGFVIGEATGDDRPMIGRQSADMLKKFSS